MKIFMVKYYHKRHEREAFNVKPDNLIERQTDRQTDTYAKSERERETERECRNLTERVNTQTCHGFSQTVFKKKINIDNHTLTLHSSPENHHGCRLQNT